MLSLKHTPPLSARPREEVEAGGLGREVFELTSVSCHVTVDFERVSLSLRVDPVLPVSVGVSDVPDILAGKAWKIRA